MRRRTLLKLGLGATVFLVVAGGGLAMLRPGLVKGHLTPSAKAVFAALARAVLEGSLPADAAERQAAIAAHLQRLENTLAAFPAGTQVELSQLLALLASTPGRIGLAGLRSDWPEASIADLHKSLQGMRSSGFAMRQQVYHALRDLTNAAFYADPTSWSLLGYPGPQAV